MNQSINVYLHTKITLNVLYCVQKIYKNNILEEVAGMP